MKSYLQVITYIFLILILPTETFAQENSLILSNSVNYEFGKNILFIAELDPSVQVNLLNLVIISSEDQIKKIIPLEINGNNKTTHNYQPEKDGDFSTFNFIDYYYVANLKDGSTIQSSVFSFLYFANGDDWQNINSDGLFNVYFKEGDPIFASTITDAANLSIIKLDQYIDLPELKDPITILAYPTSDELREALTLESLTWMAGHSKPKNDLVFISASPTNENHNEIARQTSHEIAHLRIFQISQNQYFSLPIWFNEGTASLAEPESNAEYPVILQTANDNDQLLSFFSLCESFPSNPSQLALAYAQSESFMRFLYHQYGRAGLTAILHTYIDGESCLEGISSATGFSLPQLEAAWRLKTFQNSLPEPSPNNFIPFLSLLGLISFSFIIITIFLFIRIKRKEEKL